MGKRIVILNGSPRRNGNTSALVRAFTEGAEHAGHTVTEFFLDRMNIHGCKGCFGGHSSQACPCVQRDDMEKIYPAVKDCDVLVLATPLYYWNMSGQLRTAMDRLFALEEGDGNLLRGHGRASALLMAAEGRGFEDVLTYYNHLSICAGRPSAMCSPAATWTRATSTASRSSNRPMSWANPFCPEEGAAMLSVQGLAFLPRPPLNGKETA